MSGKLASIKSSLGGNIRESMGKGRAAEPALLPTSNIPPSQVGVSRNKSGTVSITLSQIIPDPEQPRKTFEESELKRLASSLLLHGQLQPIRVRWSDTHGKYLIIAGERRWRASTMLSSQSIECVIETTAKTDTEIRVQQLVENCLREDLPRLERARAFRSLMMDRKLSARELSEMLSISEPTISRDLALLDAPQEVVERVETGKMSAAVAYEISTLPVSEQIELAEESERGKVSRSKIREVKSGKRSNHSNGKVNGTSPDKPSADKPSADGQGSEFQGETSPLKRAGRKPQSVTTFEPFEGVKVVVTIASSMVGRVSVDQALRQATELATDDSEG